MPSSILRFPTRMTLFVRRLKTHGQQMLQMPARDGWAIFLQGVKCRLHLAPASEPHRRRAHPAR